MIKLEDVCFAYDSKPILRHFDLEVGDGEFVIIKGDNGCGKTTLLNIVNGLEFPDIGRYYLQDEEITKKKMADQSFSKHFHQRIGYVFQNTDAQLFCSTVEEEIAFGPSQMELPQQEIDVRVNDAIAMLELEELRHRAPFTLSMGEKKKVALASVLTTNPQTLILDEPMNFLDKASRNWIKDFLARMKGIGKTILIVSHTDDFDTLADKVITM